MSGEPKPMSAPTKRRLVVRALVIIYVVGYVFRMVNVGITLWPVFNREEWLAQMAHFAWYELAWPITWVVRNGLAFIRGILAAR